MPPFLLTVTTSAANPCTDTLSHPRPAQLSAGFLEAASEDHLALRRRRTVTNVKGKGPMPTWALAPKPAAASAAQPVAAAVAPASADGPTPASAGAPRRPSWAIRVPGGEFLGPNQQSPTTVAAAAAAAGLVGRRAGWELAA